MKIAVNTRLLLKDQLEGIGRFTHGIFSRMVRKHPEHEFHFFFDRPYQSEFIYGKNVVPHIVPPPVRHPFLAMIWFDITLKRAIRQLKPDVFISTDSMNMLSPVSKSITVIHDINFEHYPQLLSPVLRWYYRYRTPLIAGKSDRIITVSEFSKNDLVKTYGLPNEKIDVVFNASDPEFGPVPKERQQEIREMYTDGKEYFVFIGGTYNRKNLVRLVQAFDIFKKQTGSNIRLLIVGKIVREGRHLLEVVENLDCNEDIIVAGRMDDGNELHVILGSALALTYVSVLEGFGLPLVEAMRAETPILTSNVTSIPEVVGDAALLADPFNINDIAQKMEMLVGNEQLRLDLISKGKKQVEKFDWELSEEAFYRSILNSISS